MSTVNIAGLKPALADEGESFDLALEPLTTASTIEVKSGESSDLHVTEKALKRVRAVMVKEGINPSEGGVRLGVIGGGCSGMSYSVKFDTEARLRDHVFSFGDVRIFIDPKSYIYLKGLTLDFEETLIRQGFKFINPNAKQSCSCGTSFS